MRKPWGLFLGELILAYAAEGADKIVGEILPLCTCRNAVIGIAYSFVVFVAAYITYVFHDKYLRFVLLLAHTPYFIQSVL